MASRPLFAGTEVSVGAGVARRVSGFTMAFIGGLLGWVAH
jgi:hypothetical protein